MIPVAGTANCQLPERYNNNNLRLQVRIFRSDMKSFLVLERCIDLSLVSAKARVPLQQSRPVPRSQSHAHGYIHTYNTYIYSIYSIQLDCIQLSCFDQEAQLRNSSWPQKQYFDVFCHVLLNHAESRVCQFDSVQTSRRSSALQVTASIASSKLLVMAW